MESLAPITDFSAETSKVEGIKTGLGGLLVSYDVRQLLLPVGDN
jgi:hypothetical protein